MKVITISKIEGRNTYTICGDYAVIRTSAGKSIFVDTEDLPLLSAFTWCVGGTGYAMSRTGGSATLMHRLLIGAPRGMFVDHIDGSPLNNRKGNLRVCRKQQNEFNTKVRRDNTCGYRGVCPSRRGKFRAYINLNGKQESLGEYLRPEDAARAYNKRAVELFGEFARLNEIKD